MFRGGGSREEIDVVGVSLGRGGEEGRGAEKVDGVGVSLGGGGRR